MAKIKYYYDTQTCRYERARPTKLEIVLNCLGIIALCAFFGVIFGYGYVKFFPSSREKALLKENQDLKYAYELMSNEIFEMHRMLAYLQDRDDNIYRVIFEAEPLPKEVRRAGSGGSQKFQELLEKKLTREDMILGLYKKIDEVKRQMYIQSKSYEEIIALARRKDEMMTSMPAIQPIANKDLKRFASGFGMRIDPILKIRKMHTGVDFTAARGTPVYATGDGKVITVESDDSGYGKQIEIDHGFGFVTKYAHLSSFEVKLGQRVKRGQIIGRVGSTGKSVAPHLHYEVIKNGVKVDPLPYFHLDVSPEEFNQLVRMAQVENQALGY
ncbi:MAG: M23 family metallopeptidase [Cytophagales bacterium]|nr:M23 family metallopeptidase [Cytophagales bacterium]MDW8385075.1 M23 family metallopeptidase [Flammeovirgaceae bacterium]